MVTVKVPLLASRLRTIEKAPLRMEELEFVIVMSTGLGSPELKDQSMTLEVNWTQKSDELGEVIEIAIEEAMKPRAAIAFTNIF